MTLSYMWGKLNLHSTPSREGHSQEGSNSQSNNSLVSSQAGRQAGNLLPQDIAASQEASTASPNYTLSREGISQDGSNLHSGNHLVSSQAGTNLVSTQSGRQAGRCSTRLRASQASQADSSTPQVVSRISLGSQTSPQVVSCLFRHRAPQTFQENGASPQASKASSWEGNTSPSTNSRANNIPQGSSFEEPNPKWVINLSSKPLTHAQRLVLAKGPNFAISPRHPTNLEYITAIKSACTKLSQQDTEELRADINQVLRSSQPLNPI